MKYRSFSELRQKAEIKNISLTEVIILAEMEEQEISRDDLIAQVKVHLKAMRQAIETGKSKKMKSQGGLLNGETWKIKKSIERDQFNWQSPLYNRVIVAALATAEVNAGMGKIVACPTAGASGILPAVLLGLAEELDLEEKHQIDSLITAAGLGKIVAGEATLSGAAGGCQAECGVGAGMAAAAATQLLGGNNEEIIQSFTLSLKNLLGLVCDPVAGLVEVPCVKRNAFAATHALTAAQLALSGIKSVIPPDEVVNAMAQIGDLLPYSLKETAEAGLADTPTGRKLAESILGSNNNLK